ncbi:MAG TPA: fibronectin type III domain-containing protein [Longimicrobium sp.]|jgi:hypothetical protein|uniref:fibronectin type III domain-containing protein n=1 Tax=Longimicrobium sp. TaxID=2029185 RepID=UPI002ED7AE6D
MKIISRNLAAAAAVLLLAACENDPNVVLVGDKPGEPRDVAARYEWVLEDFTNAGTPVGYPVVEVTWQPPSDWNREVFRVYGRTSGSGQYSLIATVTSCTTDGCVYRDRNVQPGVRYDFYVATADESANVETPSEFFETVSVPSAARPAAPVPATPVGLDDALYLQWTSPSPGSLSHYLVYLSRLDGTDYLYRVGQTDGTGYLDEEAGNGHEYGYRVAAVDTLGHVSNLSTQVTGVPRPDFHGELLYAFGSNAAESGFVFSGSEADNPIVPGSSTAAHFRLESGAGGWRIVPLNGTQVVEYAGRTTALACGPGADAGCRAATVAPTAGYSSAPVPVNSEFSYIFRIPGTGGVRYGVIRVQLLGSDQTGRNLMIFDWAFQTKANEPRLSVSR